MGCGVSKLEPEDEAPGGRPTPPRRRLIHRRRNYRTRKDSIVSTTELLRIDESDGGDDAASPDHDPHAGDKGSPALYPVEEDADKVTDSETKADDDERRRIGFRLGSTGRRLGPEEEELPGSPSFRFFFEAPVQVHHDSFSEDCSVEAGGKIDKIKGEDDSHGMKDKTESLNSMKDKTELLNSTKEDKCMKNEKGGRFKALMKGSSAVYCLLNGRNSSGDHHHHPHAS